MLVPVPRAGRSPATDFTVLASLVGGLLVWLVLASYALGRSQRQAVWHLQHDVARYVAGRLAADRRPGAHLAADTALSRLVHDAGLALGDGGDASNVLAPLPGAGGQAIVRAIETPGTGLAPGRGDLLQLFVAIALAATCVLGAVLLVRLHRQHEETATRTDFVRVVSHELRTPLAQILMFAETLKLGRTRSEVDRSFALDVILQEAQRLSRLVENVLRFTRLERADVVLRQDALDVAHEVHDVATHFSRAAQHPSAPIAVQVHGQATTYADRDALRQVLVNLLDNAFKHGGAAVQVGMRVERRHDSVDVTVHDDGPGISASDRDAIWAPFSRGSRSPDGPGTADRGTGLGLTIVRGLVTAMNGTVRCEVPSNGRGSQFVVSLRAPSPGVFDAPTPVAEAMA